MGIIHIQESLAELVRNFSEENFIYDLLLAYNTPKTTVTLLRKGNRNLSKRDDQIILKKKMFFQEVEGQDLHSLIDELDKDEATHRHSPRFLVVTDHKTLLAIDLKTRDSLDIDIKEIHKHSDFFLPLAGREKYRAKNEAQADVKAAEKMARIYDEILKDNEFTAPEQIHGLNIFLSRLLFCFFAEDTGIFEEESLFTNSISSHTLEDGSDLDTYLNTLFEVLNSRDRSSYPEYLKKFEYVNGGLFGQVYYAPKFSAKSRKMIIECGELDWSAINPDIFGSMIQAVVHKDQRSGMGMHYTSVPNIMKVIEPLFLNELQEEFEKHYDNPKKLEQLISRLTKIRIFDPACGSGNFLIIAYKELRKLEIEIFERVQELNDNQQLPLSNITLGQFYGIELDDFAHEVAILSLWLAEHQMNLQFKESFGHSKPTLPLKEGGHIVCGNATRIPWEDVCPKADDVEIYILGNPPYLGARNQEKTQKRDMEIVYDGHPDYKDSDYVACWMLKASEYIQKTNHRFAFVTTSSVSQGEQVSFIWSRIFSKNQEIFFAYQTFKWSNNAKKNAGIICVIIGVREKSNKNHLKKLHHSNGLVSQVENISPYLIESGNIIISGAKSPINGLPKMSMGSMARDGGNLILSVENKDKLIHSHIGAQKLIKRLYGSQEFLKGVERWCLWIEDEYLETAKKIPEIKNRIDSVYSFRVASKAKTTNQYASIPHKFAQRTSGGATKIIVPRVSSERREYIPFGFLDSDSIVSDSALVINDAEPYIFGVISSKLHNVWVKIVGGYLGTSFRYSTAICYNNFPVPNLSHKQKETISTHVFNVLEERELHSEKTMAELYDPDKMPDGLREAHHHLDLAVERCYRSRPFNSDEERLEYLFKLYEEMTAQEAA